MTILDANYSWLFIAYSFPFFSSSRPKFKFCKAGQCWGMKYPNFVPACTYYIGLKKVQIGEFF